MSAKTSQLQIRVTEGEKETLKRLAQAAGLSLSSYVLAQALPSTDQKFAAGIEALADGQVDQRVALNQVRSALRDLSPQDGLAHPRIRELSPVLQNMVAAIVEQFAQDKGADPPDWVKDISPLERPHFGWSLSSLRPYQIRVTPVPYKRRNVFLDPATSLTP
jgi:Mobilization protein NikA